MTLIPHNDKWFDEQVEQVNWIWSKTYARTYPHWYFTRTTHPDLFWELKRRIAEEGVEKRFWGRTEQYYYRKGYRYWGYHLVMNRAEGLPEDIGGGKHGNKHIR